MAFDLIITDEAQQDVDDAIQWYEEQQEKLGIRFYLHVEQALDKIADQPHHYAFIRNHYRAISLISFPFRLSLQSRKTTQYLYLPFGILPSIPAN